MELANIELAQVAELSKFKRGHLLAQSLKAQRDALAKARRALASGRVINARAFLAMWKRERTAWAAALALQTGATV